MAYASYYKSDLDGTLAPAARPSFLKSLLVNFHNWRLRAQTRRQLRKLPDYVLEDIGITRYQIENDEIQF